MTSWKKGIISLPHLIIGSLFALVGLLASVITLIGFSISNSDYLFVGALLFGLASLVIPIIEKVILT